MLLTAHLVAEVPQVQVLDHEALLELLEVKVQGLKLLQLRPVLHEDEDLLNFPSKHEGNCKQHGLVLIRFQMLDSSFFCGRFLHAPHVAEAVVSPFILHILFS